MLGRVTFEWITFTTDYGRRDGFVASCHGVIARIAPTVRVLDVTHEIPPQDVRHAAAVLAQTIPYLPRAVHLAVVDPGVGSTRRAVAVQTRDGVLAGPDNGLLTWAVDAIGGAERVVDIVNPDYRLQSGASHTFDGRDVFAPAAAHLAAGVDIGELGPQIDPVTLHRLPEPRLQVRPDVLETEVLTVDHFGNVQLSGRASDLADAGLDDAETLEVGLVDRAYQVPRRSIYSAVSHGALLLYVDSAGHVALAVNGGDAADELDLEPGDEVTITR